VRRISHSSHRGLSFVGNASSMALRELAKRTNDEIVVRLYWDDEAPPGVDVVVRYRDERRRVSYTIHPRRDRALDAFYHPNAYADAGVLVAA